jgi:hypothetical protein
MSPPPIISLHPLEPVLVFSNDANASLFQSRCKQARILPSSLQSWVYLPMPEGLLRVRTARQGDVAFDFDSERRAREFNSSIRGLGRVYDSPKGDFGWERVVYLGMVKV